MAEIKLYYGHLGSGKTLRIVMNAFSDYYNGRILLANFQLREPLKFFEVHLDNILGLLDQLNPDREYSLLLDELHVEGADNRNFMSATNKNFSYFVSQLRKRNCNLYYVTQGAGWAEKRVRDLTDYIVRCRAVRDPRNQDQFTNCLGFIYNTFDTVEGRATKQFISIDLAKMFFKFYRTKDVIKPHVQTQERAMQNEIANLKQNIDALKSQNRAKGLVFSNP